MRFTAALILAMAAIWARGADPAQNATGRQDYGPEYAAVGYSSKPTRNQVARLEALLQTAEVKLDFRPDRLHLDSLLAALGIDVSSQVLAFSRTSLQAELISSASPRAIYFNDSTYVAWIPGSRALEILTTDEAMGPVFYSLQLDDATKPVIRRHTGTCLICHDSYQGQVGGVPRLMMQTVPTADTGRILGRMMDVSDTTPIEQRWGGWYVTGHHGSIVHRGNVLLKEETEPPYFTGAGRGNVATLAGLFDTTPYLRPTSDIVALLVLDHQVTVQNEITYVKFKAPAVLDRLGHAAEKDAASWAALSPRARSAVQNMLERLVQRLLLKDVAPLAAPVTGSSGFDAWFQSRGANPAERALRTLDLRTGLLRHPVSYLILSREFQALPGYAKDYVYREVASALDGGRDDLALVTPERRAAARRLLAEAGPDLRYYFSSPRQQQ